MTTYKLGKKPARKGAVSFQFGTFFDRDGLPTPPKRFGHELVGRPWGMLANENHSCCVFSGAAHEHMVFTHAGSRGQGCEFTDANVLSDYAAVTGFDPKDPDTDQGTDMAQAASYRRKTGVIDAAGVRHKIDSYLALRPGHVDDLMLATYLTGATGVGLMLPTSAMDDFDAHKPWVPKKRERGEGGHYVPCIGRNSDGNILIVTWGRIHAMTPKFYERYSDEAICYLSFEYLRDRVSPEGFDETTLRSHINKLAVKHSTT